MKSVAGARVPALVRPILPWALNPCCSRSKGRPAYIRGCGCRSGVRRDRAPFGACVSRPPRRGFHRTCSWLSDASIGSTGWLVAWARRLLRRSSLTAEPGRSREDHRSGSSQGVHRSGPPKREGPTGTPGPTQPEGKSEGCPFTQASGRHRGGDICPGRLDIDEPCPFRGHSRLRRSAPVRSPLPSLGPRAGDLWGVVFHRPEGL